MPVYIIDNNSQTKAGDSKKIFHEKTKTVILEYPTDS